MQAARHWRAVWEHLAHWRLDVYKAIQCRVMLMLSIASYAVEILNGCLVLASARAMVLCDTSDHVHKCVV